MKIKVYRHYNFVPGPFVTYTITGRKEPIVETYNLDKGYLVLYASMTGGYMRRFYKTQYAASRWARSYINTFCKAYWPNYEVEITPVV